MTKTNYEEFFEEQMKNPDIRKAYEALEPKYAMIRALISRRNELRLSQTKLAKMIGMQQPAISRLEGGGLNTTVATLFKVAYALDLKVEFKPKTTRKEKLRTTVR